MAPDYDKKVPEFKKKVPEFEKKVPEESRRAHQPKRCTDNNEDEDNSPNNPNNTILYESDSKSNAIFFISCEVFYKT